MNLRLTSKEILANVQSSLFNVPSPGWVGVSDIQCYCMHQVACSTVTSLHQLYIVTCVCVVVQVQNTNINDDKSSHHNEINEV